MNIKLLVSLAVPFAAAIGEEEDIFSIASVNDRHDNPKRDKRDRRDRRDSRSKFTALQMQRFEREGFVLVGQAAVSRSFKLKTPKGLKPVR
jgi:hypothetical protein